MSPCGVEVAWALMCATSGARCRLSSSARSDRAGAAATLGVGLGDVVGVVGDAGAAAPRRRSWRRGHGRAPRTRARARRRPRRARSRRGRRPRDARPRPGRPPSSTAPSCWPNAAIGSGWIAASVPPASTTSARPSRIWSVARATPSLPEAHADTGLFTAGAGADVEPDVRRRRVGHQHRDGEGGDPARALLLERVVVARAASSRRRCRRRARRRAARGRAPASRARRRSRPPWPRPWRTGRTGRAGGP